MKHFLSKFLIFISIPIIFSIFVESFIIFSHKNIISEGKMKMIYENVGNDYQWISKIKSKHKIILAGSSTVKYGLSCSILNKLANDSIAFVNIALDARDPIETYFVLQQIDLKGVRAVYFGLDPWIFTKSWYRYRNSYLYLDMSAFTALKYCIQYDNIIFLKRDIDFLNFICNKRNINTKSNQEIPSDFGSSKLMVTPRNFNEPIEKWFQIEKYGWSQLQFHYLMKIVTLCKNRNIDFYAFIPPKRNDYCSEYKLKCSFTHTEFIDNLISVGFKSQIFGKFDQFTTKNSNVYFQDVYHLNPHGQEVYSSIFYEMLTTRKEKFNSKYSWFRNESSKK